MIKLSSHVLLQQACGLILFCVRSSGHGVPNASVFDFPGLVPHSGNAVSCVAAYTRIAGMRCEHVESTDPRIDLKRCYQEAGDAQGFIAFYVNTDSAGQQVFRLRITGPEIHLPDIQYCGHGAAFAEYTLFTPGVYHAEILHLYENFSYATSHPALKPQILLGAHGFSVLAPHRMMAGDLQSGLAMLTSGRWVVSSKYHQAFHTTCVTEGDTYDACSEAVRNFSSDTDNTHLRWQPHLWTRFGREQDFDVGACLGNRRICFSGDSQMRHAYNGFVALSERGDIAHDYWQDLSGKKNVKESGFCSYQSDGWVGELATDNCSVIFVNVGQVRLKR